MEEIVTQPLILRKNSRSSRFSSWSGDANSFRDKLFRSVYIFLLFAIDLVMFIYSINGRLWENNGVNVAVFAILGVVFVFAFVLILLLSFSKDLQNLICAFFTMLITVAFFYQFGQGDVDNFLEVWFNKHASWLSFFCIVPSPWLVGFFFGILVFIAFRFSDAILFVTLVLLFSGVVGIEKNEILRKTNAEYQEVQALPATAGTVSETSVIYLTLPKLPSYQFLNSIRDINFRELRDLLIGFYAANDFELYPNAFVKNNDTMSNIVDILNQVDYTSTTSANRGVSELINNWNFIHGGLDKYVLEYNQLFEYMSKQGYGLSTYSMPEFNLCVADEAFATDRCVIKGYKTVSLVDENVPLEKNVFALLGEWVLSLKSRSLKPLAKMLLNSSQLKNMKVISENRRVSLEGSPAIFDKLSNDFKLDSGGQFYFAYVDLPSDIYIYDEFCNVKPRNKWVSLKDNTITSVGIDEKRKAYADQAKCLVGKLQEYMEEISENPKLRRTDIFIQGVSPLKELSGVTGDMYGNFVADKLVNLAIRKGKRPKFLINANICLASDFTKTFLRNQDYCYTIDNMPNYSTEEVLNLKKNLINNSLIRGSRISNIVTTYKDWYETYKENSDSYKKRLKRKQDEELVRQRRAEEMRRQLEEENRVHSVTSSHKSMSQNNDNIFIPSEEDNNIEIEGITGSPILQLSPEEDEKKSEVTGSGDTVSEPQPGGEVEQKTTSDEQVVVPEIADEVKETISSEPKDVSQAEKTVKETSVVESVVQEENPRNDSRASEVIEAIEPVVEIPVSIEPVVESSEPTAEVVETVEPIIEMPEPVVPVVENPAPVESVVENSEPVAEVTETSEPVIEIPEPAVPVIEESESVEPTVKKEETEEALPDALTETIVLPDVIDVPLPQDNE